MYKTYRRLNDYNHRWYKCNIWRYNLYIRLYKSSIILINWRQLMVKLGMPFRYLFLTWGRTAIRYAYDTLKY
jgi:hypothetical protein